MISEVDKLRLIVPECAKELGTKVDKYLVDMYCKETPSFVVPIEEVWFSDGHGKVVLKDSVRDKDVFIFTDIGNYSIEYTMHGFINHASPNDLSAQLKDIVGACKCHANSLSIVMPLLYAARQHRRISREALTCATYLHELDSDAKIRNMIVFDAHSEDVQQAIFKTEFDNFYATNEILTQFINDIDVERLKNILFIAPDFGAIGRRDVYLNSFNSPYISRDAGSFYKKRDYNRIVDGKNPVIEHSYSGSSDIQGTTAIVIDDMIASGGSMFDVIDELKKKGVKYIYLISTYSLFTNGIDKFKYYYEEGKFDGIYTTNLSYIPEEFKQEEWLHIVDCSKYLAQIIYSLNNKQSISSLQRDRSYPSKVLAKKFEMNK